MTRWALLASAAVVSAGCSGETSADADDDTDLAALEALAPGDPGAVTTIATTNEVPWGLGFLPDGSALMVGRNTFNVVRVTSNGTATVVGRLPGGAAGGEGGGLGLAISPDFATDHWVYAFYTTSSDNRLVRVKYENGQLVNSSLQVLVSGIARASIHNGGRLRFGPDKKLYIATGDASNTSTAQNRNSLNGKILRINADGSVPSDNPFGNRVWSYGHRNPQGLAFDSQGRLWVAELGQNTWDELNLIQRGGNYGWPTCEGNCGTSGMINPVRTWSTSSASPSGLAIVNDTLYMAALRGQRLWVMTISGNTTTTPRAFFQGTYGRLRTVEPAPGGGLWLTTSTNDGRGSGAPARLLRVALQ